MSMEDYTDYQSVEYKKIIGNCVAAHLVHRNNIINAALDDTIRVVFDEMFMLKYESVNKAMITATNNKMGYSWRGPLVAYCGQTNGITDVVRVMDMDMQKFSDLAAYFISYRNNGLDQKLREGSKITAVKTYCDGERKFNNMPFGQAVKIPRMHPIFDSSEASQISKAIGMPLLFFKDALEKYPEQTKTLCNKKVTFMHTTIDLKSEFNIKAGTNAFGWVPVHWLGDQVPNVLIARIDRQLLEPEMVEAFGDFCHYHLLPHVQWEMETTAEDPTNETAYKKIVLDQIIPEIWSKYLNQWQKKKAGLVVEFASDVAPMGLGELEKKLLEDHLFGFKQSV